MPSSFWCSPAKQKNCPLGQVNAVKLFIDLAMRWCCQRRIKAYKHFVAVAAIVGAAVSSDSLALFIVFRIVDCFFVHIVIIVIVVVTLLIPSDSPGDFIDSIQIK